ncbi:MAG: sugar ABC transporter permease [Lachnospiraceae bacterium]|nr:sugar ABC transporter permease [Lachnospiraceae bacterium]
MKDAAAVDAIEQKVTDEKAKYAGMTGTPTLSNAQSSEISDFVKSLRQETLAIYDRNTGIEFYNKENMPQILDDMDACIIESNFIGLRGYAELFSDTRFWLALGHTVYFTAVSVLLEFVLGMLLALIMNKAMKGIGLIRTAALIPWAIPTAVSAMIWSYLYDGSYGVVAKIFADIGLIKSQTAMLLTANGAMSSAILADVWKTTPYMALLLLGGLQIIDRGLYESAAIDGAGQVKIFFKITLPLMKSSILVALLFRTLDAFRVYDLIAILTGGGPGNGTESLSVYSYKLMFGQSNFGYGSVVVTGMFICVAIIAFIYVKVLGAEVMSNE